MTTGTNPDVRPDGRRWATELLGIREDACPAEARRAYLRKLRASDFLPPRPLHRALRILDGGPAPAEPDGEWLIEEESRLRDEIASFVEEFFTLPAAQRRARWEALLFECQHAAPLAVRLKALKAGLDVESPALPSDQSLTGRLAVYLLRSFPLPPLARAASRQAFLREVEGSPAGVSHKLWEKAARHLRAEWPTLAALDEEVVRHVAQLRGRLKRRSQMQGRSQRKRRAAATVGGKKRSPWWILVIVVGLASGILRGVTSSSNSLSPRATAPLYYYDPPDGAGFRDPDFTHPTTAPAPGVGRMPIYAGAPPISELLDPSKFDVDIFSHGAGGRILRFTPRPDSTIAGPSGPKANSGRPVLMGEAMLMLMGVSGEQMDALCSRAAEKKPPDDPSSPPSEETNPKRPKSVQGDEPRP